MSRKFWVPGENAHPWKILRPIPTAPESWQVCTDAPTTLRTSSILRVSSTFCSASTGSMSTTEGLNIARAGSMSNTERLSTASTGSMGSKSAASTGVSAVSNPEILGVYRVSAVQNPEILRVLAVYIAGTLSTPVAPHEGNLLQRCLLYTSPSPRD